VSALCVCVFRASSFFLGRQRCLCLCLCAALPRFILPPWVQRSPAILKVGDDTVGEGSVITATRPSPPPPSISPSLLSCVLISAGVCVCVALGMWTLLNFPAGG